MTYVTLGNTGITVNKNGFGALPVQRASVEDGVQILRRAYEGGIRYFDTARAYTDSEYRSVWPCRTCGPTSSSPPRPRLPRWRHFGGILPPPWRC